MVSVRLYPCMFCVARSMDLFFCVCCVSDRGNMVSARHACIDTEVFAIN